MNDTELTNNTNHEGSLTDVKLEGSPTDVKPEGSPIDVKPEGSLVWTLFAFFGLGFLNLIIALPIFCSFLGVLIGFFGAALGIGFSGLAVMVAPMIESLFPGSMYLDGINPGVMIFTGVGLVSMGALFFIGSSYLSKYFFKGTVAYIKMNVKIVKYRGI